MAPSDRNGQADVDPVRAAADKLRKNKTGVDHGSAKVELPGGDSQYVEYFRGKDLVRWLTAATASAQAARELVCKTGEKGALLGPRVVKILCPTPVP
jgi:hypothetical protein